MRRLKLVLISGIAVVCLLAMSMYVLLPIVTRAPGINHYKNIAPFTMVVELKVGREKAAQLVRGERLEFCSYVPVTMCVKFYLDQKKLSAEELVVVRDALKNPCQIIREASVDAINALSAKPLWIGTDEKAYRQMLSGYAGCVGSGLSVYQDGLQPSKESNNDLLVLTLVEQHIPRNSINISKD